MNIKVHITTELFDRDGKLLWRRKRRSKSFVRAFLAILVAQFEDAAVHGIAPDQDNVSRTLRSYANSFKCDAAAGSLTEGIVVGTGSNAVDAADYALQTLILHGVTSGKLSYSAVSFGALSVADPNVSFTLQRDMTNSSGASITVNEEGIYARGTDSGTVTRYFCIIRDVEASGVVVADGQNLRVTYTIQTST